MATHSRRELLRYLGALSAAATFPVGCDSSTQVQPPPATGYFTAEERGALTALANAVIPVDDTPGGADLGAVAYIERLLTAFDDTTVTPFIFAGGPFSGRAPFPDDAGHPSTNFPPNDFATFVPLGLVKHTAWVLELYGSSGLPGGAPNEALLGPVVGLRDRMKTGLAEAIKNAPGPLDSLPQQDLLDYFATLEITFKNLIIALVTEGAFGAPEYGGNKDLTGWKLTHYEGDQQPLGYSVWSTKDAKYVERPEAPVSTPNPDPDPEPMSADTIAFIDNLVAALGGTKFA